VAQPKNAEQIIFNTPGDFSGPLAPFGFWIWCEDAEAGNPYEGVCQGSMYFYDLGMVSHVAGSVVENADGTYTMSVFSTSGTRPDPTSAESSPTRRPTAARRTT